MLQKQTLTQLRTLKLSGMADALELQWSQPQTYDDISFTERLALMINQEITSRNSKRLQQLLKAARFKISAGLEDVGYTYPRGLMKKQIATLQADDWGLKKLTLSQRNDLLEIMEDLHATKSTIVTSLITNDKMACLYR